MNKGNSRNVKQLEEYKNKHEFYSHSLIHIPNLLMGIGFSFLIFKLYGTHIFYSHYQIIFCQINIGIIHILSFSFPKHLSKHTIKETIAASSSLLPQFYRSFNYFNFEVSTGSSSLWDRANLKLYIVVYIGQLIASSQPCIPFKNMKHKS